MIRMTTKFSKNNSEFIKPQTIFDPFVGAERCH
jgi:hypothetical protein